MLSFDILKERDVCALGWATIDLYAAEYGALEEASVFNRYLGGSPANTAVALAALGARTGYIGRVSDDYFGRFILSFLEKKGVDISHISVDYSGAMSGMSFCEMRHPGEKMEGFMYRGGCADLKKSIAQPDESYIAKHKALLISGTSLSHSPARDAVLAAIEFASRNGTRVILDLDYRPGTWELDAEASVYLSLAAGLSDIILGTRDEYNVLEGLYYMQPQTDEDTAGRLLAKGVSVVVIKRGSEGSTVFTSEGRFNGGIYPAKVCNTHGAGDSYSGAFNYSLIRGMSMEKALQYAAVAATYTISRQSCSEAMPSQEDIEAIIRAEEVTTCW